MDLYASTVPDLSVASMGSQWKSELRELIAEHKSRQVEALKLYEPLPFQKRFHEQTCKEAMMVKGNQVGGSLALYAEVARAVTNQDPYRKYPEKDGVAACLVYGQKHVGRVLHKYLFRWGAFDIIRDEDSGLWRVFRPWSPDEKYRGRAGDAHRSDEAKPAPPLIPKRFIDGNVAWEKRAENIFSMVKFTTGWTLYALNSEGDFGHAQGYACNLFAIDEDIAKSGWYAEAVGRCSKPPGHGSRRQKTGLIRWAALPHAKTDDILRMLERSDEEKDKENPKTVTIEVHIDENPFLSQETRDENKRLWMSLGEAEYMRRVSGKLDLSSTHMYPQFDKRTHNVIMPLGRQEQAEEADGKILRPLCAKFLTENRANIPHDWTRYVILDPGYNVLACLFFAVPPPSEYGTFKICYDELYIRDCTAPRFGKLFAEKVGNDVFFQDFIADMHGGRLRSSIDGVLPIRAYEKELSERNIGCEARGSRFMAGSDNIERRENATRAWLEFRSSTNEKESGWPTVLFVIPRTPNTEREIRTFQKKIIRVGGHDVPGDEGKRGPGTHTVECLEYAAAHGLPYVKPPQRTVQMSHVDRILQGRKVRAKMRQMRGSGPGIGQVTLGPRGDS